MAIFVSYVSIICINHFPFRDDKLKKEKTVSLLQIYNYNSLLHFSIIRNSQTAFSKPVSGPCKSSDIAHWTAALAAQAQTAPQSWTVVNIYSKFCEKICTP